MIDGRRGRKAKPGEARSAGASRSIGARLVALGIGANAITAVGVLLALATGLLLAYGDFFAGVALITVGGLMDTLDGHVAKVAGTASPRGAFLDSVSDRVGDSLIFFGVAGYFVRTGDGTAALLPIGVLAVGNLISYERAKAESLGFNAQGGIMERAERLIFLAAALLTAGFVTAVLVPLLWVLGALSLATAIGRFVRVWQQASGRHPTASGRNFVSGRRRAWRTMQRAEKSRRSRRELAPLSTRLRGVFGAGSERAGARRERTSLRRRSAHPFVRRIDIDR